MKINFDFTINAISILAEILAWFVIGLIAYKIYKNQIVKPKVWKTLFVLFFGLFTFTINWNIFDMMLKLPILPLGVWILFFMLKRKGESWQTFRSFAWLGFFANFIFLLLALVSIPVHHEIYPQNEASTYISTFENATVINIHPSAINCTLNKEKLLKQLNSMSQEKIYSNQWYEETYMNNELTINRNERFPYQLIGTSSKWGSGYNSIIYIEDDGKGILISTQKKQLYFRSNDSLIQEGE